MINATVNTKSATTALLLAIFLGGLGLHRFYLGRVGTGLLRVLCLPLAFVPFVGPIFLIGWHLLDILLVANRSLRPANGAVYA